MQSSGSGRLPLERWAWSIGPHARTRHWPRGRSVPMQVPGTVAWMLRRDAVRRNAVVGGVGWRCSTHRVRGPVASRPPGPAGGGLDTTRRGWPGRSGPHAASAAGGGLRTRPAAGHRKGTHSRRRGRQGRRVGGLDNSGGPAHLQRLTRCPTQHRGQQDGRGPQPRFQSGCPVPVTGRHGLVVTLAGFGRAVVWVGLGGGLAADHHPGHGPITGQAPTRLRGQWPCPAHLATHPARTAKQAVQLHRHQQLGPDPTRLG
jgi:hypothetical protein